MRDGGKAATASAAVRCGAAWRRVARAAMRSCSSIAAEAGGIAAPVSLGVRTRRDRDGPRGRAASGTPGLGRLDPPVLDALLHGVPPRACRVSLQMYHGFAAPM